MMDSCVQVALMLEPQFPGTLDWIHQYRWILLNLLMVSL
jgi:hypothetical protein